MRKILPQKLIEFAECCPTPLYVVGGFTRDFLLGKSLQSADYDISAPLDAELFCELAKENGFTILSVYKTTGTVKLRDMDGVDYEFSCFRSDKYVRGTHQPVATFFTDDIMLDAKRRDFTANAVYYDVKNGRIVDPLDGVSAIKEKRLTTVDDPKKVFGEDGLRLLRLARQSAHLGFRPDEECLKGARENAELLKDISAERIYHELELILYANERYGNKNGPYDGLKILDETRVLDVILPELALGRGMYQRADYHNYDVLEHTFKTVLYADKRVRLAALLHDVAKPYCFLRDGNFHEHPIEGERIATEILTRLKAPKKTIARVSKLVAYHMYDLDCKVGVNKLRRFFVGKDKDFLEELLLLKQADFSGCKDDLSTAPTVKKWREILDEMKKNGVPMQIRDLALKGDELIAAGVPAPLVSKVLNFLLKHTANNPLENEKERLLKIALSNLPTIEKTEE